MINRGYSGYNTRWASQLVDSVAGEFERPGVALGRGEGAGATTSASGKDDIVTVFFGANDAALATGTGSKQHVPVDESQSQHERAMPVCLP